MFVFRFIDFSALKIYRPLLLLVYFGGLALLIFTLFFLEDKSSFFQYREDPKKTDYDHTPREATVEDLGDFLDILEKPLYLIG